jgi:hypothetical protein
MVTGFLTGLELHDQLNASNGRNMWKVQPPDTSGGLHVVS